jgi:hypothetical protein
MSAGNIAYLALVLCGYAVFILVLGAYWLRSAFGPRKAPPAAIEVTPAHLPVSAPKRRRAA